MIRSSLEFDDYNLHFEIPVKTAHTAVVEVRLGPDADLAAQLYVRRDDVCKLFVALRGWLLATEKKAIRAGCYNDKGIIN